MGNYLLLKSYCGPKTGGWFPSPECSDEVPCPECLQKCHVFAISGGDKEDLGEMRLKNPEYLEELRLIAQQNKKMKIGCLERRFCCHKNFDGCRNKTHCNSKGFYDVAKAHLENPTDESIARLERNGFAPDGKVL